MGSYALGFIVCSEDEEHAKETAKGLLKDICAGGHGFDYGSIGRALLADSPKGKEVIEQIFGWMIEGFREDLMSARETFNLHGDDEILTEECRASDGSHERCGLPFLRYRMHCLGMDQGPSVRLYDKDGSGIRTRKELDEALKQEKSRLFVVTADASS